MNPRPARALILTLLVAALVGVACSAPAMAAEVTIGANVNQSITHEGTCAPETPSQRPCTIVTTVVPGQTMSAPCDGTVTRFRLNGFVKPANHYSLRVVRRNTDGSFTGTATSAPVAIATDGINEYATSLPIATGELIGIDFLDSTEGAGIRWVEPPAVSASVLFAFPADGGSAFASIPATFYYLFNADIACASASPSPAPAPVPSNAFSVVKLKKTILTLSLASAGTVTVSDAGAKPKAKASASKAKPKLLKPSSASGGPGQATVKLKLTGAAKAMLKAKGRVKVKAKITFTPTGGTAAVQVHKFTVRAPKAVK
jgi:hypothetical protein